MIKWRRTVCGYVYDLEKGDPNPEYRHDTKL